MVQSASRSSRVSSGKSGRAPASNSACRSARLARRSRRREFEPFVKLGEEIERRFGQDFVRTGDSGRFGNDAALGCGKLKHVAHCSTGSTQIE